MSENPRPWPRGSVAGAQMVNLHELSSCAGSLFTKIEHPSSPFSVKEQCKHHCPLPFPHGSYKRVNIQKEHKVDPLRREQITILLQPTHRA